MPRHYPKEQLSENSLFLHGREYISDIIVKKTFLFSLVMRIQYVLSNYYSRKNISDGLDSVILFLKHQMRP